MLSERLNPDFKSSDEVPLSSYTPTLAQTGVGVAGFNDSTGDKLVKVGVPINIEYKYKQSGDYSACYHQASYFFYHCASVSTICKRMAEETLRRGIGWKPRFQSKCPQCGIEYPKNVTACTACGYHGRFVKPDPAQKKLLINWRGRSLLDECNVYGWSMEDLMTSFLLLTLIYNQPIMLSRSLYITSKDGTIKEEIPQEFIPVPPESGLMLFNEHGLPGDGTGFTVLNRSKALPMKEHGGYDEQGRKLYPARWCISETLTGNGAGTYYADEEIYHSTYGVTSLNYGLPLSMLVSTEIKAIIAMTNREERYFAVGHPMGFLVINGADQISLTAVKKEVQQLMADDPYMTPMLGIPPVGSSTDVKWLPIAQDPTSNLVVVKRELMERVSSLYGMPSFIMGDLTAHKGTSNEGYQLDLLDRSLFSLRRYGDRFLDWVVSKYKAITDWNLTIIEPPDKQSADEADEIAKELNNGLLYAQLGFPIISQSEGHLEVGATPKNYDPLLSTTESLLNPIKGNTAEGANVPQFQPAKTKPLETAKPKIDQQSEVGVDDKSYTAEQVQAMLGLVLKARNHVQ